MSACVLTPHHSQSAQSVKMWPLLSHERIYLEPSSLRLSFLGTEVCISLVSYAALVPDLRSVAFACNVSLGFVAPHRVPAIGNTDSETVNRKANHSLAYPPI